MNKVDIKNINNLLEWRKLKRVVDQGVSYNSEGSISYEQLFSTSDEDLQEMVSKFETDETNAKSSELKVLIDDFFKKYGTDTDNIIILSAVYYSDDSHRVRELDFPLEDIAWDNFGHRYNKLYYPINPFFKDDESKEAFYEDLGPIYEKLAGLGIPDATKYYEDDNDALNEYWCGVIGIMKDYKAVAFVIRDDGMLCDEKSYESCHNKIINQL